MKSLKLISSLLIPLLIAIPHPVEAASEIVSPPGNMPREITLAEALQKPAAASPEIPGDFLTQEASLSAVEAEPLFLGVEEGGTVSGLVEIRPSPDQIPGIRKVAYYLNGAKSGKVYQSPFIWGGVSGNGTAGFDTRTIADGAHTLGLVYTDAAGDHEIQIHFNVNNSNPNPNPNPSVGPAVNPAPATTPVAASGRTLGGETFPAGVSFVDVEQTGNYSFAADRNFVYLLNSSNTSDPQVLSSVSFETEVIDAQAASNGAGVFVLEKGLLVDGQFRSRLWFVSAANPANPGIELKVNLRDGVRLSEKDGRLQSYYTSQGENFLVDCALTGSGACTVNFYNLYVTPDLVHRNQNWIVSAAVGSSFISLNHHDVTQTPTAAPVAFFTGQNNYVYASLENGTLAIYDINQADTSEQGDGILPVVATVNPDGNNPVKNYIFGNRLVVLDETGLIEIYDLSNPANPSRVDSFTAAGARAVDFDGTNFYVVTEREYRIIGPAQPDPNPSPAPNPGNFPVLGVTEGQTVSGVVNIRPDQSQLPGIRKVAYYLNGAKSGKVYQSPFTWGGVLGTGTAGFDTQAIPEGAYELAMVYTDATGDHTVAISFNVDN